MVIRKLPTPTVCKSTTRLLKPSPNSATVSSSHSLLRRVHPDPNAYTPCQLLWTDCTCRRLPLTPAVTGLIPLLLQSVPLTCLTIQNGALPPRERALVIRSVPLTETLRPACLWRNGTLTCGEEASELAGTQQSVRFTQLMSRYSHRMSCRRETLRGSELSFRPSPSSWKSGAPVFPIRPCRVCRARQMHSTYSPSTGKIVALLTVFLAN